MRDTSPPSNDAAPRRLFPSTQWTHIHQASNGESAEHRREALGHLFLAYWQPVYVMVRRQGHDPEAARDLTQSFFTAFLERNFLRYVDPARGRFRSFLRTALDHHLADEWDRARAQKRGGRCRHVTLDPLTSEGHEVAAAESPPPVRSLERAWAQALLGRALATVRASYQARGRVAEYQAMVPYLVETEGGRPGYAALASRLGVSQSDVTNRLHRLRKRYRAAIWTELRGATSTDSQAREELRDLFAALAC